MSKGVTDRGHDQVTEVGVEPLLNPPEAKKVMGYKRMQNDNLIPQNCMGYKGYGLTDSEVRLYT